MAVCPKCSKEMSIQGDKMVCSCGYQYSLPKKIPSYQELIDFIKENEYEQELECWLEVSNYGYDTNRI